MILEVRPLGSNKVQKKSWEYNPHDWISVLIRQQRKTRTFSSSSYCTPPCEDIGEGSCLQTRKTVLTRNQTHQYHDLGLSSLLELREINVLLKHLVYGVFLQQSKPPKILSHYYLHPYNTELQLNFETYLSAGAWMKKKYVCFKLSFPNLHCVCLSKLYTIITLTFQSLLCWT